MNEVTLINNSFLSLLRNAGQPFDELTSKCRAEIVADFADLCWGSDFNILAAVRDPGISLDNGQNQFVLMRVGNEIRYYAGTKDPYSDNPEYELGVFPSVLSALAFGRSYLLDQRPFADITIERSVRDSSARS